MITVWLEVRNIDMMSFIDMVQLGGFPCIIADQWLLYSRVNLTLHNILEVIDGPITTTKTSQFHAWVTKCIQTRVKSNLASILQHWNRDCWKKNYFKKAALL